MNTATTRTSTGPRELTLRGGSGVIKLSAYPTEKSQFYFKGSSYNIFDNFTHFFSYLFLKTRMIGYFDKAYSQVNFLLGQKEEAKVKCPSIRKTP